MNNETSEPNNESADTAPTTAPPPHNLPDQREVLGYFFQQLSHIIIEQIIAPKPATPVLQHRIKRYRLPEIGEELEPIPPEGDGWKVSKLETVDDRLVCYWTRQVTPKVTYEEVL